MVTPGQQRPLCWRERRSRRRRRRLLWRRRGRRKRRPAWNLLTISSQLAVACTTSLGLTEKQQPILLHWTRLTRPTPSKYLPSDVGHDSFVLSSQPTDPTESSIRRKSPDQSQVRSPIGISPPSDYQAIDNKTARLRRLLTKLNLFKLSQNDSKFQNLNILKKGHLGPL